MSTAKKPADDAWDGAEEVHDPEAEIMREFNEKYMVVKEGGKIVIYEPYFDPVLDRSYYERIHFDDFRRMYLNREIAVGMSKKGVALTETAANVWLKHPDRHQYLGGIVFDPSDNRKDRRDGVLNLWEGFNITRRKGRWDKLKAHIFSVICSRNHKYYDYLLSWMARMLQHPGQLGEVAVVLYGGEGVGKGILARALVHILGRHGMQIANGVHLVGKFNAHLRDCVFLFADEAFFAGDKAHVGVLKALITERYLTIEGKGRDTVQSPNFLHIMMATNSDWAVPAGLEARRFFILKVPDTRRGDFAYFKAIQDELEDGGYEAMLDELLNPDDLKGFNVRDVPQTEGLQEQKQQSLDTNHAWWQEVLHRGYVYESKIGLEEAFQEWLPKISFPLLFASYEAYVRKRGERHPLNVVTFGKFMTQTLGARHVNISSALVGEHLVDRLRESGKEASVIMKEQASGYFVGELDAARDDFMERTKLKIDWHPEDDEPGERGQPS